jgi:hypothetical protein
VHSDADGFPGLIDLWALRRLRHGREYFWSLLLPGSRSIHGSLSDTQPRCPVSLIKSEYDLIHMCLPWPAHFAHGDCSSTTNR